MFSNPRNQAIVMQGWTNLTTSPSNETSNKFQKWRTSTLLPVEMLSYIKLKKNIFVHSLENVYIFSIIVAIIPMFDYPTVITMCNNKYWLIYHILWCYDFPDIRNIWHAKNVGGTWHILYHLHPSLFLLVGPSHRELWLFVTLFVTFGFSLSQASKSDNPILCQKFQPDFSWVQCMFLESILLPKTCLNKREQGPWKVAPSLNLMDHICGAKKSHYGLIFFIWLWSYFLSAEISLWINFHYWIWWIILSMPRNHIMDWFSSFEFDHIFS